MEKPQFNRINLNSTEPHVTIHCPICNKFHMVKVEETKHETDCDCKIQYTMKQKEPGIGEVQISFSIPEDKKHYFILN